MPLPGLLTLLRHGESEGNIAVRASRHGDDKYFTEAYINRHSANLRLTDHGVAEAKQVGLWIKANNILFTHFYCSSHLRAIETAGHLNLQGAMWRLEPRLRERDFGDWDMNSYSNRAADPKFLERGIRKTVEGLHWRPPNGDSVIDDVAHEVSALLNEWSAIRDNTSSLIAVTHNDKMRAFQVLLSRENLHAVAGSEFRIGPQLTNCHILQYSRLDPNTNEL